ncbi:peptide-N4-(N-acetyl-beta-glucosaminyl)asparagine amidase A [Cryptomeria japonica]|uniref:peptide-N4-(N-acetyl-beta- glucosaminyl)asparagine amidase A n=1 Tax=Cryptomeria japonica TaxID=3369 RepID=UPI0027DA412D|nr:peptide-N4-(N-acetyl-beta-glucosaminyl)asparagine amidase A [Cryptomeria japonica]XP_057813338.2 peptide-N4-(N-acetyl-beta-glucosaminyl)asparagine amidase A [Cryptomeria japonica]
MRQIYIRRFIGSSPSLENVRMEAHLQWWKMAVTMILMASETPAMVNLGRNREISDQIETLTYQESQIHLQTEGSAYQVSQTQSQNEIPPLVDFEVTKPIELPKERPCSIHVLQYDFGYTYGKPPVIVKYNPPKWCPDKWSKVFMEWKATCKGRQYDRIAGVWLSGVEILRTCTAEPTKTGVEWTILKDITKYSPLLKSPQILEVKLANVVDKTYTGVYHVNITFHFYEEKGEMGLHHYGYADSIIPISLPYSQSAGAWFQIQNASDMQGKSLRIPPNAYRAVLEIYVSFHSDDEFWYSNPPNVYIEANNLTTTAGNGPFREVLVLVDDIVVGAVWPFPVVYTGGINPLFWRPVSGIGSFTLPSYEIEITPFLGRLLDGEEHKFSLTVTNALSVWFVDANLHLWLDAKSARTSGKLTEYEAPPLETNLESNFKGLDGSFITSAHRKISHSGWVESSQGKITTNISQEYKYINSMTFENNGDAQTVEQSIRATSGAILEAPTGILLSAQVDSSFPTYMYYAVVDEGNDTTLEIANFSNGFNMDISIVAPTNRFFSSLNNTQNAEGYIFVQNNLVSSGLGSTQETYRYRSTEGCYSRSLSVSNYTFLSDHIDTYCSNTS